MEKFKNVLLRIWKSIKSLFVFLFGFGKMKDKDRLKEEELISPAKQVFKKFIRNRLAIMGLTVFLLIAMFVGIGSWVQDFNATQQESSQIAIQPGRNYLNIPSGLKKSGVKVVTDNYGNENYLIGTGVTFSVAVSNDDKIYVWGSNVGKVKDVPKEIRDIAKDFVQLAVGSSHVVALTKDGELVGWGRNNFEQASIPIYDPALDSTFGLHKKAIEAYFDPAARTLYPSDFVSAIEDDPIVKVVAGYEYTSILTIEGHVYTWGSTKSTNLSLNAFSYNYLEPMIRVNATSETIQWKYTGATTSAVDSVWQDIVTYDEIINDYNLIEVIDDPIQFRLRTGNVQWKYQSAEATEWVSLFTIEALENLFTTTSIVDVDAFDFNMVYKFEDGSFDVVGLDGTQRAIDPILRRSSVDRGFEVKQIVLTKSNGFALRNDGNIISWGERNVDNQINVIPEEVNNANIVMLTTGTYHVVAIDDQGNVYTWGNQNTLNQLNLPKNVKDSQFIISQYFNSISVDSEGKVSIWGNRGYIFGTDLTGSDIFSRVIAGGSITLTSALVAVVVSLVIGLIVGLIAGFYGGWLDNILMRFGEIVSSFPFLPLAMTLAVFVQENDSISENERIYMIMAILGVLSWPGLARLVRGQILAEREKDFVMASKALGIKEKHIITRHILPNVINVVIVSTTLSYAGTLLTEAGLSFLGFGVKLPNPSWGNLLTGAQKTEVLRSYWWMWIIPALFLITTALSINLVGDGLREAMDPKSNER
ncbi:MAG: ABC transporter permease subunit [Bacilli bacterium]